MLMMKVKEAILMNMKRVLEMVEFRMKTQMVSLSPWTQNFQWNNVFPSPSPSFLPLFGWFGLVSMKFFFSIPDEEERQFPRNSGKESDCWKFPPRKCQKSLLSISNWVRPKHGSLDYALWIKWVSSERSYCNQQGSVVFFPKLSTAQGIVEKSSTHGFPFLLFLFPFSFFLFPFSNFPQTQEWEKDEIEFPWKEGKKEKKQFFFKPAWSVIKELFSDPRYISNMAFCFKEEKDGGKRAFGKISGGMFMQHLQVFRCPRFCACSQPHLWISDPILIYAVGTYSQGLYPCHVHNLFRCDTSCH